LVVAGSFGRRYAPIDEVIRIKEVFDTEAK
jgi:hypothetical protein